MDKLSRVSRIRTIVAFVMVAVLTISATYIMSSAEYGDSTDPLISLSYLNQVLVPQIKQELTTQIKKELTTQLTDEITAKVKAELLASGVGTGSGSGQFVPVQVPNGKTLVASEGSILVIIRAGNAKTVIPGSDGISNLTQGTDVTKNNVSLTRQNLYLISRPDGRGLKAEGDSWFMVSGAYKILD